MKLCELLTRGLAIAGLSLLAACSTAPKVFVDRDPAAELTGYKTFVWAQDPPLIQDGDYPISPLAERRMTQAIEGVFIEKGYQLSQDPETADFAVTYTLGVRDRIKTRSYPSTYVSVGRSYRWGGRYYGLTPFPTTETRVVEYKEGSLSIDVYDVQERIPVWHASASKRLSDAQLREASANADEAARLVLADFPISKPE
ncbi:MAG: DUF4136 domain-containing protein [Pseudomonadota bacterium]